MPYSAKQVSDLQAERTNDPLTRGYSGFDDAAFFASITADDRPNPLTTMSAGVIFNTIVPAEFAALAAADKTRVDRVLNLGAEVIIGPDNSPNAVQELLATFGGGSATITALAALRDQSQTRANEIGLPNPILADVQRTS